MHNPITPSLLVGEAPRELKRGEVSAIFHAARAYKLDGQPSGWRKKFVKPSSSGRRSYPTP